MHSHAKPTTPKPMWNLANPTRFLGLADRVIPWLAVLTFLTLGVGLYLAFFVAPPDYQQGETVRIMFVHVPAAWLAMFGYTLIAIASIGSLIWRRRRRWRLLASTEAVMLDQMHILVREFVRRYPDAVEDFRIPDPQPRARPHRDAWGAVRHASTPVSVIQALSRLWSRPAPREV